MTKSLADLDLASFWNEDECHAREYTDDPLTQEKIDLVEKEFGYQLPASYIALMTSRNGGAPLFGRPRHALPGLQPVRS
jgi:cell wall assembly regulator SMI1